MNYSRMRKSWTIEVKLLRKRKNKDTYYLNAKLLILLLRLPLPEVNGGLGDLEGCLDELGVETLDLADVGVSDPRLASSTYFGFWIDLRRDEYCCSSDAMARAGLARWRLPLILWFLETFVDNNTRRFLRQQTIASHDAIFQPISGWLQPFIGSLRL